MSESPRRAEAPTSVVTPVVQTLAVCYLGLSAATVVVLAVLSAVAPEQATTEAWVRAVIVAATSVLTVLFTRRAAAGRVRALLRLRIIVPIVFVAVVLVLLFLPLPVWLIVEQAVCGVLLLVLGILIFRHPSHPLRTEGRLS